METHGEVKWVDNALDRKVKLFSHSMMSVVTTLESPSNLKLEIRKNVYKIKGFVIKGRSTPSQEKNTWLLGLNREVSKFR